MKKKLSVLEEDLLLSSALRYSLFKPDYDNIEKEMRWQLAESLWIYRCKLAGRDSSNPHTLQ